MKFIMIWLCIFLFACEKTDFEKEQGKVLDLMEWLNTANPYEDVADAIEAGDFRVMGVYGYSLTTPGVEKSCLEISDIKPIKGTTDAVLGYEHAKMISVAHTYAEHYNLGLQIHLSENNQSLCSLKENGYSRKESSG